VGKRQRDRHTERRVRVRGKRLAQIDETKMALALWLLAKQIVEDHTEAKDGTTKPSTPRPLCPGSEEMA
jgi:hypothetical protein